MDISSISLPLKRFLLIQQCPLAWKDLDLYLFRDDEVAFYVGQSHLAFARVWDHLLGGFKGHSIVGRFVWANWPRSMKFKIELFSSRTGQFDLVGNELNAAEELLIHQWSPCFNASLNSRPNPVPASYMPWNAKLRCSRSLNKLIHEAERVVKADDTKSLLQSLD